MSNKKGSLIQQIWDNENDSTLDKLGWTSLLLVGTGVMAVVFAPFALMMILSALVPLGGKYNGRV